MAEVKKGLESLMAAYEQSAAREPGRAEEYKRHVDWAIERAKQYAEKLDRDYTDILAKWEQNRDYWFVNYYQEANQPDLSKCGPYPVLTYDEFMNKGKEIYGVDMMDWKFKCPQCGHVHSLGDFQKAGIDINKGLSCCASRFPELGYSKPDCKWTTGGLFKIGGQFVISQDYIPILIFAFADGEDSNTSEGAEG